MSKFFLYKIRNRKKLSRNLKILPNSKKILLISHEASRTGAPVLLLNILKELKENNVETFVISRRFGPLVDEFVSFSPTDVIYCEMKLKKRLKELQGYGFDKVICNTTVCGDWTGILRAYDFRVITLVHELPQVIKTLNIEDRAVELSNKSNLIFFPASFVHKKFLEITELQVPYRILTQGLFIGKDHVVNKEDSKLFISNKYNIKKSKIVLNVATGAYRKGFDLFIRMAINNNNKNLVFIWVGDYDSKILSNELKNNNLRNIENLILTGYICDPEELVRFYDAADIFALTSREEPFGSVVLEAFNSEVPVVGFENAGGFIDVVKNDKTGYLVEYENIQDMYRRILSLSEDDNRRNHLGNNAKEIVKKYNFKNYVKEIINSFEEIQ